MQAIEALPTLEHHPPAIGALFLQRIDRPALIGRRGEQLVGFTRPRRYSLIDSALHGPHYGFGRVPARAVDLTIAELGAPQRLGNALQIVTAQVRRNRPAVRITCSSCSCVSFSGCGTIRLLPRKETEVARLCSLVRLR